MKEITRIHIAKVAYDIELNAKKELENYIAALEQYAGDKELLDDIEIRITELLSERGVAAGGVISDVDIAAVHAQLGEPSDFAPEDDEVVRKLDNEPRHVYRDEESAVLGGVLAGFGRFFGIDPLWVRIAFIILLFASFGAALLVYLIFWLIIPPARTAAEKLRMSGKPVTLASIKSLGEKAEPAISGTAVIVRRLLRICVGFVLIAGSIAALVTVVAVVARLFLGGAYDDLVFSGIPSEKLWWIVAGLGLFPLAGLLLSALCIVLANAALRSVWTKRTAVAVVAISAAALIAFAGGVGTTVYGQWLMQTQIDKNHQTTSVNLPANFMAIKTLHVLADDSGIGVGNTDTKITYTVSDTPRYELVAPKEVKPEVVLASDGLSATVKITKIDSDAWRHGYLGLLQLHIYGPMLERIDTAKSSPFIQYTTGQPQDALSLITKGAGTEVRGTYGTITLESDDGAATRLDSATVNNLLLTNKNGTVEAGVVQTLQVTLPDACPAMPVPDEPNVVVQLRAVSSGELTYNGKKYPAKSMANNCGKIIIGDDTDSMQ